MENELEKLHTTHNLSSALCSPWSAHRLPSALNLCYQFLQALTKFSKVSGMGNITFHVIVEESAKL